VRRRRRGRVLLILLALVLVAVAFVLVGWFPQELLRGFVETRLKAALGPKSSIKRMHVLPGRLSVEVYDLVIEGPTYRLEVPHTRMVLTSRFLISRALAFKVLEMESPRLSVFPGAQPGPKASPLREPLDVRSARITNATVSYQAPRGTLVFEHIDLSGSIGGIVDVSSPKGAWNRPEGPFPFEASHARVRVSPLLELTIEDLTAAARNSRLHASGPLGTIADFNPDLRVDADLDLADINALERRTPAMSGKASVSGRWTGSKEGLRADLDIRGGGIRFAGWPVDEVEGHVVHSQAGLGRTDVDLSLRLLGGSGRLEATWEEYLRTGHARFAGVDIDRLRRQGIKLDLPLHGTVGGDVYASGNPQGNLGVKGSLRAQGLYGTGLRLTASSTLSGRVRQADRSVDLAWQLILQGAGATKTGLLARLRSARVNARGTARGALPPAIEGRFTGDFAVLTPQGSETFPATGGFRTHGGSTTGNVNARGLGGALTASLEARPGFIRRLDVNGASLDLAALVPEAKGRLDFELQASGPSARLAGTAQARIPGLVWKGVDAGPVSFTARGGLNGGRLALEAPALRMNGEGTYTQRQLTATLSLNQTPLAPLQPLLSPNRPLSGLATGTASVVVPFAQPSAAEVRARLETVELASGDWTIRTLRPFTLTSLRRRVDLEGLQLEGPGTSFTGSASVGLDPGAPLSARGTLDLDLSRLPAPAGWQMSGRVAGDVTLSGTRTHPQAAGTLTVAETRIQRPGLAPIDIHEGVVELAGDTAIIRGLRATAQGGSFELAGQVPLAALLSPAQATRFGIEAGAGTLDLRAQGNVDLSQIPLPPGWALTGQVQGHFELTGTRTAPRVAGLVTVGEGTLRRPGLPTVLVHGGEIELAGDKAILKGLSADSQGVAFNVTGEVPLSAILPAAQSARLGVEPGAPFSLRAMLDVDLARMPSRPGWTMAGTVKGDVAITGTLDRPRAEGTVALRGVNIQHGGTPLIAVADGDVQLAGDSISAPGLKATVAGGTVTLSGQVPLASILGPARAASLQLAMGDARLDAQWTSVRLEALLDVFAPDIASRVAAALTGQAHLEGPLHSPEGLRGEVTLDAAAVKIKETDETLQFSPFTVRLEDGLLTTDGAALGSEWGEFRASGQVDLRERTVRATGKGALDLHVLGPFLTETALAGSADVDLFVEGPLSGPRTTGTARVQDATLRVSNLRQALTSIHATLAFDGTTVRLEDAGAMLGGGNLSMTGSARLNGFRIGDVDVHVSGKDLGLRYPVGGRHPTSRIWEELKTRLDADLTLTGHPGEFLLAGGVIAQRALYDADIFPEQGLLAPEVPPSASRQASPFLQSVALNLTLETANPFVVRNNMAQLGAMGTLTIRGDLETLAPFGRFEMLQGGKVFLQNREFTITSGSLTYTGSMDPEISVQAETLIKNVAVRGRLEDVTVRVAVDGPLDGPSLNLDSDSNLSQQELASLVATGTASASIDTSGRIVGQQAATLLAGRFTRQVARQLMDLGLDQVEIQPDLLSREGDPRARFTFGKQVTRNVRLIYSVGLNDAEARYYQANIRFRPGREVNLTIRRDERGTYTYAAGQRLRLGGKPPRSQLLEEEKKPLGAVNVEPRELPVADAIVRQTLNIKPGDQVTYWDLMNAADRLQKKLVEEGFLETVVETRLEGDTATFFIHPGAHYRWRVEGMEQRPDLTPVIQKALFEEEALDKGRDKLLEVLRARGHYRATVETRAVNEQDWRTLLFLVTPGPALALGGVHFPGAKAISEATLLQEAGGPGVILTAPKEAEDRLKVAYRARQYLMAEISPPKVTEENGRLTIEVPVNEGPRAVISGVRFEGATLDTVELTRVANVTAGSPYDDLEVSDAVLRVRDLYLKQGYAAVRVSPALEPVGPNLEVVFKVVEGVRSVVGPVEIKGLRRTNESVVRGQVWLTPGEPLDPRKLAETEQRLRNLGIFSRVVVSASAESAATIRIEVEEEARYALSYDLRYNTDEKASALVDAEIDNVLGWGINLGGRYRRGRFLNETRGSIHFPSFFLKGDLTGSLFRLSQGLLTAQEIVPGVPPPLKAESTQIEQGLRLEQALHYFHPWEFLYGYRYKRVTTAASFFPEPITITVGGVDASIVNDSRDSRLNPRGGKFLSLNLEADPTFLGSSVNFFFKSFGQVTLTSNVGRYLTWAQGYRLGLARGLAGLDITFSTERFKAGGANSVRGYGSDALGPHDSTGLPLGGLAVLVLNQELRYSTRRGLGAAVFWDAGNVWPEVKDMGLDLRHALGVGLRYDSPLGLLRLDLGIPLNRRPGDHSYQVFLGLGQAF
jgi:outer membrane protein assembly complex protein YaeT